ncbi:hypothetical protein BH20GEM2_BH20GEM2_21040 [soil metagenome]
MVPVAQIDYITADGPYAELHVAKQTHVIRERMKTLDRGFARIHRSTIVDCSGWRRRRLISTADYIVKLLDGTKLKVSRGRRPALAESLGVEF